METVKELPVPALIDGISFGKVTLNSYFEPSKEDEDEEPSSNFLAMMFYPCDFEPRSARQIKAMAADLQRIQDTGCKFLACSTDSEFTHFAWLTSEVEDELSLEDLRSLRGESIKFPLLADKTGVVGKAMGVFDEKSGMHKQALVVLGKGGRLRARNIKDKDGMFYVMDVVDAVKKAREAEEKANQTENENTRKSDKNDAPQIQAG